MGKNGAQRVDRNQKTDIDSHAVPTELSSVGGKHEYVKKAHKKSQDLYIQLRNLRKIKTTLNCVEE